MGIVLFRVDERLIHGQVTVGWGSQLKPVRYLVVDDALPETPCERGLYELGLPVGAEAKFYTVTEARARLATWQEDDARAVLLTRDLDHMLRLAEGGGLKGVSLNLGGIHHGPRRSRVLPYLFLDSDDRSRIQELEAEGLDVFAQDLPGSSRTTGRALIDG